jgi:hypothetical protein
MKKLAIALFVLLTIVGSTFAAPPIGGTKPPVWGHQTEELLLQGTATRDQLTDSWNYDFGGGWLHYVTDATEIGAVASFLDRGDLAGQSFGGVYRWNLPRLKYGNIFLGGRAAVLSGDASDAADGIATAEVGYRLYVGQSAAVILSGEFTQAVSSKTDNADALNVAAIKVGFSIGKTPAAKIQ